jgi:phosphatidylinositol-3-phosphatase
VPPILATPGFAPGGRDVLFIVGDEVPAALGFVPMPFVVVSPLAKAGTATAGTYNHYSLLATIEDGLGLPRLGNAEASATIADVWR